MKISDVLWEAACNISDRVHETKWSCDAIWYAERLKNTGFPALKFYKKYFSPKGDIYIWFEKLVTEDSQNERFFHLLSAYHMTKGMGL